MIGKTVSHYRIIEKLGEGGMGVVYKAEDTTLKRLVALKFLPADLTRDAGAKARFIHEAQAASALDNPNICTVFDILETADGQLFMVMPCYEGQTLKEKIERGVLDIDEAVSIAEQIGQGLAKAHDKGIVHRDIKPANIFITHENVVKILDFGIAKLAGGRTKLTKTGSTLGTVAYMSPEQAMGKDVGQRTDIWSVGVVLYEMLTGQLPFKGEYDQSVIYSIINEEPEMPSRSRLDIPEKIEKIIMKCLEKKPENRFGSTKEISTELQVNVEKKREKKKKKKKIFVYVSLFLLFIVFTFGALYFYTPLIRKKIAKETETVKPPPVETSSTVQLESSYQKNFAQAQSYYQTGQYENALHSIELARKEKSTTELTDLETSVNKDWDKQKAEKAKKQQANQERQRKATEAERARDAKYQQLFDQAKNYYRAGQYENALHSVDLARIEKSTTELTEFETLAKRDWDKYKEDQEKQKNALEAEKRKDINYQQHFDQAKSQYQSGQYENAWHSIELARIEKNTKELADFEAVVKKDWDKYKEDQEKQKNAVEEEKKKDTSYQQLVDQAKSQYQSGQFENALRSIKLAEIVKTTPELANLKGLVQGELEQTKLKEGDLVALGDVTQRPVKVSGNPPVIPVDLRGKYGGMAMTVNTLLLIDEKGTVSKANLLGTATPDDIRSLVSETLLKWKYNPAQKGTAKVKVWLPVQLRLIF